MNFPCMNFVNSYDIKSELETKFCMARNHVPKDVKNSAALFIV